MKTKLFTVFIFAISCTFAQTQITFQKSYGTIEGEQNSSVEQTNDGGYILTGALTSLSGAFPHKGYLLKTDSAGNIIWVKSYSIPNIISFSHARQTADSGYIVVGYEGEQSNLLIIKTDVSGNLLWAKSYGDSLIETGYNFILVDDGGCIVLGSRQFSGISDIYLIKIDSLGNQLWSRTYGGPGYDIGYNIRKTADGGFIISAGSLSFGSGNSEIYRIKIDANGNLMWSKIYGGPESNGGGDAFETQDGGYIMLGHSNFGPSNLVNVELIRTNSSGDTLWTKTYGKPGTVSTIMFSFDTASNGNYVMTGKVETNPGQDDGYFFEVDSAGNYVRAYTFQSVNNIGGVHKTSDGGFILSSTSQSSFSIGFNDFFLAKTDSSGNTGCYQTLDVPVLAFSPLVIYNPPTVVDSMVGIATNISLTVTSETPQVSTFCSFIPTTVPEINNALITVFPNPSPGIFTIEGMTGKGEIKIYNFLGEKIIEKILSGTEETINLSAYHDGMYVMQIAINNKIISKKLMVCR